jgi:outer membrane protein assembly factor BamB
MRTLARRPPDPMRLSAPDEAAPADGLSRWLVAAVGVALAAAAIAVVASSPSALTPEVAAVPGGPDSLSEKQPDLPAPAPAVTREEFLANWPSLRGPGGLGIAHSRSAPTDWDGDAGRGILWKVPVPRPGFSSPVVWEDKVFLTGADENVREVYCFDAETGELAWRREVAGVAGSEAQPPNVSEGTGYAASTMATDGERVFAIFATGNIAGFDFNGNVLWERNLGVPENPYGYASSLITCESLLFVQFDQDNAADLFALNAATGRTAWEVPREVYASWASPVVAEIGGRVQVILNASPYVISYDAATGEELMKVECVTGEVAPSPAYADGIVFVASEYGYLGAVDTATKKLAWEKLDDLADVSSPLAAGKYMWLASGDGTVRCFAGATGDIVWQHEFDEGFYSSPILVGDLIYLTDQKGVTWIFKAGGQFELVGSPALGERSDCTGAFVGGRIYMRGEKHLFCVETAND